VQEAARARQHVLGSFPIDSLRRLAAVMMNNVRLLSEARLDVFAGDITLFTAARPTPGLDRLRADPGAWQTFCSGNVRTLPIDAEHHRMLSPDSIKKIHGML
jgi:thioesterase domain-containing protein